MTRRERALVFVVAVILLIALTLGASVAEAQPQQCGERQQILSVLADKYGEVHQSFGLTASGALVETFANPDTGTWTITVTLPAGRMCMITSGQAFEAIHEKLAPTGLQL